MMLNEYNLDLGGGTLLQVSNRTVKQMMSYIIDTPEGGVIVIDGGFYCEEDAMNLYRLLEERGKKVDLWFITHAHSDHLGAFVWLMDNAKTDIEIKKMCYNFPDYEWLSHKEDFEYNSKFLKYIEDSSINAVTVQRGDVYTCGSVSVEVISVPVNYHDFPQINPTSIIFKVHFPKRDVLFLGDFDENGEAEFNATHSEDELRCDIVQMAHHGQCGVTKEFYEKIKPRFCLYAAPQWLWENNQYMCLNPETAGTGPFSIMETRKWMAELEVLDSFTQGYGDWLFK